MPPMPTFPAWRDADTGVTVLVSQYGYHPDHPKTVTSSLAASTFLLTR